MSAGPQRQSNAVMVAPSPRFDTDVAAHYDRFRALRPEVVMAIHQRIVEALPLAETAIAVEIGAGTGRIGSAFIGSRLRYLGIDSAPSMLARFRARSGRQAGCVLASATALPLEDATADLVLTVQVLGVIADWIQVIAEARRVLRPGGWLVSGRLEHGETSLHTLVRETRNRLLRRWGIATERPGASEAVLGAVLAEGIGPCRDLPAVLWSMQQTPRSAVEANLSGWRVQTLPGPQRAELRQALLQSVAVECDDLDAARTEVLRFSLHAYQRPGH